MTKVKYISIMNAILVIVLFVSIIVIGNKPAKNELTISKNSQLNTYLESTEIEKIEEVKPVVKTEVKEEKSTTVTPKVETKKEETKTEEVKPVQEITKTETNNTSNEKVIERLVGGLAGYGPDCSGCSPYTSTGKYIGNGNIYYEDKQYGKVRIVAGDKSFPFGTIVRITNTNYYNNAPIYAIVLDRGGVGRGKKFLFDLLFNSEKEASDIGSRQNVIFEILRLGY